MKVNIFNKTSSKTKQYEKVIKKVFETVQDKRNFNIIFVDESEIRKINKEYRNIDKVTDVISFALLDNDIDVQYSDNDLGDIFICLNRAIEQANEYGHTVEREIGFLSVHGYLHLIGYDHMTKEDEKVMFSKQDEILDKAGLKR